MRRLLYFAVLFCFAFRPVAAQTPYFSVSLYPSSPDTQYVLPGESWHVQYGVQSDDQQQRLVYVNSYSYIEDLLTYSSDYFSLYGGFLVTDTMSTWHFQWYNEGTMFQLRWMPNYLDPSFIQNWLWLYAISTELNIPIGQKINYSVYVTAGELGGLTNGVNTTKWLVGIDGIRGDVNRDGLFNQDDVSLMFDYFDHHQAMFDYTNKYTLEGINYGLGRVLFSRPDEVSLALLNLWIHNPSEPAVQGLGLGQPFGSGSQVTSAVVSFNVSGGVLHLETEGNIVNVSGYTADNQIWQKTVIVENSLDLTIPDDLVGLQVESVNLPNSSVTAIHDQVSKIPERFFLAQNYPNPFNPVTIINYDINQAGPISLVVYDLLGREVAVLESGYKTAGTYQATFDGTGLSSGTYLCRLTTGNNIAVKKMILVK